MKKTIGWIHLWLGLVSGLIVFIVSITGCIYVFRQEISSITEPWLSVPKENKVMLLPSRLKSLAEKKYPGKRVRYISYEKEKAAYVGLYGEGYSNGLFVQPYSGRILSQKDYLKGDDFFSFVLHGHRALWLPYPVGRPIVDWAVLLFLVLLISGLVLWWPKRWNRHNREKSFTVKWSASFKRLNYDLHNVLGFYTVLVLFVIACTGLVWGFNWFERSVYWVTSGGRSLPAFKEALSDRKLKTGTVNLNEVMDSLAVVLYERAAIPSVSLSYPDTDSSAIQVNINYQTGTNYKLELRYYDRYTLKELPGQGIYAKKYQDARLADKISRMNYDLHTGQILGLPTKILVCMASLISASLPVTGFLVWWGKRRKKGKKKKKKQTGIHDKALAERDKESVTIKSPVRNNGANQN